MPPTATARARPSFSRLLTAARPPRGPPAASARVSAVNPLLPPPLHSRAAAANAALRAGSSTWERQKPGSPAYSCVHTSPDGGAGAGTWPSSMLVQFGRSMPSLELACKEPVTGVRQHMKNAALDSVEPV